MDTNDDSHPSKRDLTAWWARYYDVAHLASQLGRLPRLSDGVAPAHVSWPAAQRRATTLNAQQRAALAALPGWSNNPRNDAFEDRAEELRVFIATRARAPRVRGKEPGEVALAHWLSRQRVAMAEGRLTAERARVLSYVTRQL